MNHDIFANHFAINSVSPTWIYVDSKDIIGLDGFLTDYTWYTDGDQHIFMFGDIALCEPCIAYADHVCISDVEALEWFNSYSGLEESLSEDISPEDAADNEIIKRILDKTAVRTNAKLTQEEQDILDKYQLLRRDRTLHIPDIYARVDSDSDISNHRGGNIKDRRRGSYRDPYHNDPEAVNYPDIIRKRKSRVADRDARYRGDKLNQWDEDRRNLKSYLFDRKYHQKYVDAGDRKYQAALDKARAEYEKAIRAAETERDRVDTYHQPALDRAEAKIKDLLHR